ncbi:ALF repeat-containing protein [Kitasatospora aburaviensis]
MSPGPDTASDTADDHGTAQEKSDRAEIERILADKETGPRVRAAAEKALKGTAADLRHFLEVELESARHSDNRVLIVRILNGAGPAVTEAAEKALMGTYAESEAFLKEGQYTARAEDQDRAEIERILADKETSPGVREAAEKALKGTAADMRHFLTVELERERQEDNRVLTARIASTGGPAVEKAAGKALRGPTRTSCTS